MGLVTGLFRSKRSNILKEIAADFSNEERKKTLFKESLKDWDKLSLNQENLFSYIIAIFYFEVKSNPIFQTSTLKKEYSDLIEGEINKRVFKDFYYSLLAFTDKNLNHDKVVWMFSRTYLENVWNIKNGNIDIILLTAYSVYLTQVRINIRNTIIESFQNIVNNQN